MNAIPAVSQVPVSSNVAPANDASQASGGAAAHSAGPSGSSRDFAAALSSADPKPTRKPVASKANDNGKSGGQLPGPGNLSPPPTSPPAPTLTLSATVDVAVATAAAASGAAAVAAAIPSAQAKEAKPNSGGNVPGSRGTAAASPAAASPGAGFAQVLGLPVADASREATATAQIAVVTPGPGAAQGAAVAVGASVSSAAARTAGGVAAGTAAGRAANVAAGAAAKPMTAASAKAANNAATSAPSTTDGNQASATNTPASTNIDSTSQATTAAAMWAAATSAASGDTGFARTENSSSPTDGSATPATGSAAQGMGSSNGAPVPALAVSAAAAAAAKAGANAPVVTTFAPAGVADKRTSSSGDSSLPATSGDSAAGAAQLSVNTIGAADATPMPNLKVNAGVGTPEFGQGLADRVSWMVDHNLNGAKLQVNPPQLGPIEVQIAVQGNHAQVWLTSHSALTRDALEASSPKLREMLGAQGFGQVSVDISQRSFQERSAHPQPYEWTPAANHGASTATASTTAASLSRISNGVVDAYA